MQNYSELEAVHLREPLTQPAHDEDEQDTNQIIHCHHCGVTMVIPAGDWFEGWCGSCSNDIYASPEPEQEETTPMPEYTPQDSLTYLNRSVDLQLEVATDLIYQGKEVDTLPENLQDAVSILDALRNDIRKEAEHHGAVSSLHYSNGVPTSVRFNDEPITDPDGQSYLPEVHTDVHPSGTVRVFTIPTTKEF